MITQNPEMFIQQHRNTQRVFQQRDRRGELSARVEALRSVARARGDHTGPGTWMAVALGEALISFGQRLKERGMADSPAPVRMH